MISAYIQMFAFSVRQPAEAARMLFAKDLSRNVLWTAMALAAVLNTLIYMVSLILFPPVGPVLAFLTSPVTVLIMLASVLVITVFSLFWTGQVIGGKARFTDILAAVTWLQYMRVGLQLVALLLMLVAPQLASFAVFAAGLYGLWILINFLNVAHRFDALPKAFLVLVLSALGMIIGLSMFLSVIGAAAMGLSG